MSLEGTGTSSLAEPQIISWSSAQIPARKAQVPVSLKPPLLCDIDTQSLERLYRFQSRTVLTVGTVEMAKMYQGITLNLAFGVIVRMSSTG